MRRILISAAVSLAIAGTGSIAGAATPPAARNAEFESAAAVLKWMNTYREKPDPLRAAEAIRRLSALGELRNPESAGVYLGFAAGVLADNPGKDDEIVSRMLPLPAEDQWLVVRAIAYSGAPRWRYVMTKISARVPARHTMLLKYLNGALPGLAQYHVDSPKPSWWQQMGAKLSLAKPAPKPVVLEPSPELLDTFWGYYYATGKRLPVQNIVAMLPWSKNKDDIDKLTLGGMAKFTLAQNAARDPALLTLIKSMREGQAKDIRPVLDEVIEAADDVDVSRVRREMLAALDELRRKGSESRRNTLWWGQIGEGAVAAGCITAAVAGQAQFAIPCVVGGAVSSGALRLWSSQD